MIRVGVYNVEWFDRLFTATNTMSQDADDQARLTAIGNVLRILNADLLGIVEAPNSTANGNQSTVQKLRSFSTAAGLRTAQAVTGFISGGRQEIAVLFDPNRVSVVHRPGGRRNSVRNPRFDAEFRVDSDSDRISEIYEHYRPPLEALVTNAAGDQQFWLMVVHAKSKGIFDMVDQVHLERESQRNRRKLFAEATSIRRRVDQWLDSDTPVAVIGDINDGPGMDWYEKPFGRSAVEVIMGDIFEPDRVLRSHTGRPVYGRFGWEPSSARFTDRITEDPINVLIDHILVSSGLTVLEHKVWNPFQDPDARNMRDDLLAASDHFPVTVDIRGFN